MACVLFTCRKCDWFWTSGPEYPCPKCGSFEIEVDYDEKRQEYHPDLDGFYERKEEDEE